MRKTLLHFAAAAAAFATSGRATPADSGSRLLDVAELRALPVREGEALTPDGVRLHYRVAGAGDEVVIAPFALYHGSALDRLARGRRIVPYGAQMMADRQARTDAAASAAYEDRVRTGAFAGKPAERCRASNAVSLPPLLADPADAARVPDVCGSPNEHEDALGAYFGALFATIDGYDWRRSLAAVGIPRLILHGERDNIPLAGNEEWARGQPNARLMVIRGAGHFPAYEQPEATLGAIAVFLDGDWPPGADALPAG